MSHGSLTVLDFTPDLCPRHRPTLKHAVGRCICATAALLTATMVMSVWPVRATAPVLTPGFQCPPGHPGCTNTTHAHFYLRENWANWGTNYYGGRTPGGSVGIRV
jgi:hypothetical protein